MNAPNTHATLRRSFDVLLVLGDVHGEFHALNAWLENQAKKFADQKVVVLQCGDFGFWPEICDVSTIKIPENIEIFACAGNHENWDYLDTFEYTPVEMTPRLWYMPFGTILNLTNEIDIASPTEEGWVPSTDVLFCGGADSIDKMYRKEGVSWWPQEVVSQRDIEQLDMLQKVDIVISHCAPTYFDIGHHYKNSKSYIDPSRAYLNVVYDMYRPPLWYCGHYHQSLMTMHRPNGADRDTRFEMLDCIEGGPHFSTNIRR